MLPLAAQQFFERVRRNKKAKLMKNTREQNCLSDGGEERKQLLLLISSFTSPTYPNHTPRISSAMSLCELLI